MRLREVKLLLSKQQMTVVIVVVVKCKDSMHGGGEWGRGWSKQFCLREVGKKWYVLTCKRASRYKQWVYNKNIKCLCWMLLAATLMLIYLFVYLFKNYKDKSFSLLVEHRINTNDMITTELYLCLSCKDVDKDVTASLSKTSHYWFWDNSFYQIRQPKAFSNRKNQT